MLQAPGWFAPRLAAPGSPLIRRASCLLAAAAAAACTVGPNYTRPQIEAPAAWRVGYEQAAEVANARWWEGFGDPALNQLVDAAVRENLDVQIAAARVDQFLASVTTGYTVLRALDRQLEIAKATAQNYADTLRLFELRFKGGVVSEVELAQIQSQYQQALAAIPAIERQIALQENLLSILLGRNPDLVRRGMTIEQLTEPRVPNGLPSSLLERRPDILQAEQQLRASNAEIGVAKSLYYPTLSLTGVLGLASTSLGDFVSSDATTGSLAAGLFGPIFTFGRIEGQVSSAEAAQREALAFYRQVVLNAFRETNDALVGVQKKREEHTALVKRVEALRHYSKLSRVRFDNGAASYLEVLYAENELFGAELTAVRTLSERYGEPINVYKAMGGGWVDLADPLAPRAQAPSSAAAINAGGTQAGTTQPSGQDRMDVVHEGAGSVLNVYRVRGIGGAVIKARASGRPQSIVLRFHGFPELESFTAKTPNATLQCEVQRPEGRAPEHRCRLDNQEIRALRKSGELYDVALPASILTPRTPEIEVRWVDQWR